jgi:CopG family transcriptional regulator, nickel-responsive regulator
LRNTSIIFFAFRVDVTENVRTTNTMDNATRFSISTEPRLLEHFDALWQRRGSANRSEAIKALMRAALIDDEWTDENAKVAGALVLVYDHHRRDMVQKLMDIQHDYADTVRSTQHVHLDHDNCLEVIALTGDTCKIRALETAIKSLKGLKHSALVATTTGEHID